MSYAEVPLLSAEVRAELYAKANAAAGQLLAESPVPPSWHKVEVPDVAAGEPLITLLFHGRPDHVHAFAQAMGVPVRTRPREVVPTDLFTEAIGDLDGVRFWAYALTDAPAAQTAEAGDGS